MNKIYELYFNHFIFPPSENPCLLSNRLIGISSVLLTSDQFFIFRLSLYFVLEFTFFVRVFPKLWTPWVHYLRTGRTLEFLGVERKSRTGESAQNLPDREWHWAALEWEWQVRRSQPIIQRRLWWMPLTFRNSKRSDPKFFLKKKVLQNWWWMSLLVKPLDQMV